ncbi:MAG: COP23 domain-containing protein [Desmonostoc vinosum HA7617-LM4]|jgi:hypothetical protein|nr:COP23 domain-containing protein [Desmonostoc vinosum HA7617-LM4]
MQLKLFYRISPRVVTASVMSALALVVATTIDNQPSYAVKTLFFCTQERGVPVTKIRTSRGNETFIRWAVQDFKKYPPAKRCQIISARLQRYYEQGWFFITSRDNFNNYPVLCIAYRKGVPCESANLLLTFKPGTDTRKVLQQMLNYRRFPVGEPIDLSECQVFSYDQEGNLYLDVKQFVDSNECR